MAACASSVLPLWGVNIVLRQPCKLVMNPELQTSDGDGQAVSSDLTTDVSHAVSGEITSSDTVESFRSRFLMSFHNNLTKKMWLVIKIRL